MMKNARWMCGVRAFALAETLVAMLIVGVVCVAVYGAISVTFQTIQATREGLRATQILEQTMEVIRLCNWDQTDPSTGFLPRSFTQPYYTDGVSLTNGPFYEVTVTITNPPPLGASYSNDVRMVQIQAAWTSGGVQHNRTMSTYVSQWGLQNYVW
jgi:Tfp pilus assembly protein PilV